MAKILSVTNEGNVNAEFVLKKAEAAWKALRGQPLLGADAALEFIHSGYKQFAEGYPIVVQYMSQRVYTRRVFARYLAWLVKHPLKSEADFLGSQAKYVQMLYKNQNPRSSRGEQLEVYQAALSKLTEERDMFKKSVELAADAYEEREAALGEKNREELREWTAHADLSGAGTIRVIAEDLPPAPRLVIPEADVKLDDI
jgi:hypothetical protein